MSLSDIWVVALNQATGTDLALGARALAPTVNAIAIGQPLPGADLTLVLPGPSPDTLVEGYAQSIAELLSARGAQTILFGADAQSLLLAGQVAGRLGTSALGATEIAVELDHLVVGRVAYGGLAVATTEVLTTSAVLVVGPGVLPVPEGAVAAPGQVEPIDATATTPGVRLVDLRPKVGESVNLAAAKRVVGVGRGFAAAADLDLARALAAKLGAELACSRPIAEGVAWLPTERYVGVSGVTLHPDLYVAVGISGQIQHMAGVSKAKTIVAINKDKTAPVFKQVDFGVVGDLYEVLPALVAAL
jgi:electron transfer flavoprotein alpha subunit